MKIAEAKKGMAVRYVPAHAQGDASHPDCEDGIVSSVNEMFVFVRFNAAVATVGWDVATSCACRPEDLVPMVPEVSERGAS